MTRIVALAFLLAGVLPGCASSGERVATSGQPVVLQVGERVALADNAALRYVAVTADSRCPPGVQCIRAGDADVAFEFTAAAGASKAVTLNLPKSPQATVGDWKLELLSLEHGERPAATVRLDPAR
jgi:hypothetical protein